MQNIREGLEDLRAGRVRDAERVFAEIEDECREHE
jgi:hypothetical protein